MTIRKASTHVYHIIGLLTMQLNANFRLVTIMVELGLVDYFVMGEAVGIVATFVAAFYY